MVGYVLLGVVLVVLVGGLVWRWTSRQTQASCPAWLIWMLENPFVNRLAGGPALIERLDIEPGMQVLDVGCGPGRLAIPMAEAVGETGHVTALDVQPAMLAVLRARLAERTLPQVVLVEAGAGSGALEQEAYDRAYVVTVLGEIPDQMAALREIFAALRPGGLFAVVELLPDPHFQSKARVRRLCGEAGFRLVASYGPWCWFTMVFERPA